MFCPTTSVRVRCLLPVVCCLLVVCVFVCVFVCVCAVRMCLSCLALAFGMCVHCRMLVHWRMLVTHAHAHTRTENQSKASQFIQTSHRPRQVPPPCPLVCLSHIPPPSPFVRLISRFLSPSLFPSLPLSAPPLLPLRALKGLLWLLCRGSRRPRRQPRCSASGPTVATAGPAPINGQVRAGGLGERERAQRCAAC